MEPIFPPTPSDWRKWLEEHHSDHTELWVGYYKKATGLPSMTWAQSVDEALCFGWIDGIRKSIDETAYKIRFTPRKTNSIWSAVNIKRIEELIELGLVHESGLKAYQARKQEKSEIYAYEQNPDDIKLDADYENRFQANQGAWDFFQAQAPSYKRPALWWIISAKKAETREKRLLTLIEDSANGRRLKHLTRNPK